MISLYSPDKPFQVYSQEAYWSDDWNAIDYGMDVDPQKAFFPQFQKLLQKVPRLAIVNKQSQNSDYCNFSFANKNCYLTFGSHSEEDCYCQHYSTKNKNCADSLSLYNSELCYGCIYSKNCYRSVFLDHCEQSSECFFSVDLKGCQNCIFSSNLRNKQYYILNKQYSKEEYFEKLKSFEFHRFERFEEARQFYLHEFRKQFATRNVYQNNCEDTEGGTHENCKNLQQCFDCTNCEACSYCIKMDETYHSLDADQMGYDKNEWCYETIGINGAFNIIACESSWHNSDLYYSSFCFNSKNCFGSVSLNQKEYCILNMQYSKEEYENLVPQIIENMMNNGEWGEFFPTSMSPFSYNETIAYYDATLSETEVTEKGWKWKTESSNIENIQETYIFQDDIKDVTDEILSQVLKCEQTGKFFKIQPQELDIYRQLSIPVPHRSPQQRHLDRLHLRNPRQLWDRNCDKCQKNIQSSYSPERPEKVYCEQCYLKEVY
jgi:hypothetical protein